MRILVTGAAGFIGSHLSQALLLRGDSVVGVDNLDPYYDPRLKRRNLAAIGSAGGRFESIEADIRDAAAISGLERSGPFDAIVHLAGLAGVRSSMDRASEYVDVNVGGTAIVLDFARRHKIPRFVFASSSSVYGEHPRALMRETDPVDRPLSPYAATKQAAEALCHSFVHMTGLGVTVLRFFSVYGPRQRPDMAVHRFASLMTRGEPIPIFGDGSSERDYTFVEDVIRGIVAALDTPGGWDVLNLGCGRPVPLLEMIHLLAAELQVSPQLVFQPAVRGDVAATCADISRAQLRLGYAPRVEMREGIRAFVSWFKGEGSSVL